MYDHIRLSCAVPDVKVADVSYNLARITEKYDEAVVSGSDAVVFPELCITGCSCGDLFLQRSLISASCAALVRFVRHTLDHDVLVCVGAPIAVDGRLYSCGVLICGGRILGIVPKTYISDRSEAGIFSSAAALPSRVIDLRDAGIELEGDVPFGQRLIISHRGVKFAVELGDDIFAPVSPSQELCLNGAEVILCPASSNEIVGRRVYREQAIVSLTAKSVCAYCYASAGAGESTTDMIFSGHSLICSRGKKQAENTDYIGNDYIIFADIDVGKIAADRLRAKCFADNADMYESEICTVYTGVNEESSYDCTFAQIKRMPFVPESETERLIRCGEIFEMQTAALRKRMSVTDAMLVLGVSGGMDSTLALLVCAQALKEAGRDTSNLVAVTMPGFGTTDRTYNNALALIRALGATEMCVPIAKACEEHFRDIGHDINIHDVTYENAQARERTQILMDIANEVGGFVVGTGDLSELALGWCTYNADQMSMYGVNAGVPKTLVRWTVDSVVKRGLFPEANEVLRDILDTPISPELLPPDETGNISQKTEDLVGPYELHDFFIYNALRFGFTPSKIYFLACRAFDGVYEKEVILKWLKIFYRRFFTQQFKRSCMPDGVKVGSIGLSPRGDLHMPSDASYRLWTDELDRIV